MTRRVLKWNVPVDDRPHPIGTGPVVLVACQYGPESVQVWTEEPTPDVVHRHEVQVFGTGQPLDGAGAHVGSVVIGSLVWHVYERTAR